MITILLLIDSPFGMTDTLPDMLSVWYAVDVIWRLIFVEIGETLEIV